MTRNFTTLRYYKHGCPPWAWAWLCRKLAFPAETTWMLELIETSSLRFQFLERVFV